MQESRASNWWPKPSYERVAILHVEQDAMRHTNQRCRPPAKSTPQKFLREQPRIDQLQTGRPQRSSLSARARGGPPPFQSRARRAGTRVPVLARTRSQRKASPKPPRDDDFGSGRTTAPTVQSAACTTYRTRVRWWSRTCGCTRRLRATAYPAAVYTRCCCRRRWAATGRSSACTIGRSGGPVIIIEFIRASRIRTMHASH